MVAEATTITWVLVGTDRDVTEAAIGVLVACATFPQILLAPWIGRLADRSRRPALLLGLLTGIGALGFAGIGIGLGSIPIGVLFVVAVLVAVGEPAMMGALSGIASRSIDVSKFEAWDAASYGGAAIGAQLAVVVAVALWSSSAAVLVIGLLAVVAVTTVARLPLRPVHIHLLEPTTIGSVLSFMIHDRAIRSITVLTTISMSAFGGVALVAVDLAERSGRPADAGSHLILAMAIGAAVGAVVCIRLPPPQSPLRQAVVSVFVLGGAFAASAISWPVAFVSFAIAGFADAPLLVATFAIRNRDTPEPMRASLYTVAASLKIGGTALGAIGIGLVAGATDGATAALVLAALQLLALAACACCRGRSVSGALATTISP